MLETLPDSENLNGSCSKTQERNMGIMGHYVQDFKFVLSLVILLMEEILHKLVDSLQYPTIYNVFDVPGG